MATSTVVYDFVGGVLRGRIPTPVERRRAFAAPIGTWQRVLAFEGCAAQFADALRGIALEVQPPEALRAMLQDAAAEALRRAVLVQLQLPAIAQVAQAARIRVLALKGAARLLDGELAGRRSIGDIDLLVAPSEAPRFHCLLQQELGYAATGQGYAHHLPGLTRAGSLGIEVHVALGPEPSPLDTAIWHDTRLVMAGRHSLEIPSTTNMLLHALDHAVRVNWTGRYRLRDVTDVAALFGPTVLIERVIAHVRQHDADGAMETLISVARDLEPRAPRLRTGGWRIVRRVSRARLAAASLSGNGRTAARLFRYAGVLAEGSPRTILRAGLSLAKRALAAGVLLLGSACSESVRPTPIAVQPFVFQSDADGVSGIYRYGSGTVARLSAAGAPDAEPQSAAGRIVFSSRRNGNPDIYIADLTLAAQLQLTSDGSTNTAPALSPSGTTIAFVSDRSGTPRVWLMDATGANPRALDTGSPTYVAEGAPRWRPAGDQLAFTSTRTNTSQVYVVPAGGGAAEQISHDANGAFTPTWSGAGDRVLYVTDVGGRPAVVAVPAAGGTRVLVASSIGGVSEPACGLAYCLLVVGGAPNGDIAATASDGMSVQMVLGRSANDRAPALLVP